jgi:hypothetical protein
MNGTEMTTPFVIVSVITLATILAIGVLYVFARSEDETVVEDAKKSSVQYWSMDFENRA